MAKKKPVKGPKAPKTPDTPGQAQDRALAGLYGNEGVNAGNALIGKFLQPGVLGRVNTNPLGAEQRLERNNALQTEYGSRDPMQTDVLNRMQAGLGGYTSPEYQAQREQMMKGINSNMATSMSQLAKGQARGKVYGAASTAQQRNLITGTENSKNDLEQQLYVKNIDEMQRRLTDYGTYGRELTGEEYGRKSEITKNYNDESSRINDQELERQKINLGQANAETAAQIGAFTGAGGTAISRAQTKAAQKLSREGLRKLG